MLEYTFDIKYSSGKIHAHVDNLSRNPVDLGTEKDEEKALDLPVFSLPGYEKANVQMSEPNLVPFIQEIEKPSQVETKRSKGGILYKVNTRPEDREKLLVAPDKLKPKILSECHDNPMVRRHLGTARTIDKIRRRYYWCELFKDIEAYVRTCTDCQTKKGTNQKPAGLLQPIPSREPLDRIGIDLLGPFPKTHLVINYGTRWAETRTLPSFLKTHSAPGTILSDRGQVFNSAVVCELLRLTDIQRTMISDYHLQCNGAMEMLHATFTTMMSQYVSSNQRDWDQSLPLVSFAYNNSKQESTGFKLSLLSYGHEPNLTH
ncbi:hypothetical protein PR048_011004 [Dryococelus australis]|uniref:Integrase catalytic domain-containing protein n=1 Tax=Dryococelus australis TaxID=614101 RepID=A0ABQ9HKE4_9NEOP|nr:hypothetical protein PR048_011004 [Dryococelus australis]